MCVFVWITAGERGEVSQSVKSRGAGQASTKKVVDAVNQSSLTDLAGDKTTRITIELIRQIGVTFKDIGIDMMTNDVLIMPGSHVGSCIEIHR